MAERSFIPVRIAVLTVSDTRTLDDDTSGDQLVERVGAAGHIMADRAIEPDNIYAVRAVVSRWIASDKVDVIVSTGGTGLTGRDGTPEAFAPLMDKPIPGFGELFRSISFGIIGTSTVQSRAMAGVANGTYCFVLPGSTSACRDAWDHIIVHQLDHRTRPCNLVELMPRLRER
ncbi:MAG: molybdenum cofactor biosynthesis protein B [Myxococcota bacterium]